MGASRLVIGAGGTGRTHVLRSWVTEAGLESSSSAARPEGSAIWIIGSPLRLVTGADVADVMAAHPSMIVADDIQWFDREALHQLVDATSQLTVVASRRPTDGREPDPDALELVTEVLTRSEPALRVGLLDLATFGPALSALRSLRPDRVGAAPRALATAEVEAVHALTAGSIGLAADIMATGYDPANPDLPTELVEAVASRVRRSGPDGTELARLWSMLDPEETVDELAVALRALEQPLRAAGSGGEVRQGGGANLSADRAERAVRAGGLLGPDGSLIPLVRRAMAADLTSAQRGLAHDRLAAVLAANDPAAAASHLLQGDGRIPDAARILAASAVRAAAGDPELLGQLIDRAEQLGLSNGEGALLRALGAFHNGSPLALGHLEQAEMALGGSADDRVALLGYGIDLRELRLASAAGRRITGGLAAPLRGLAQALLAQPDRSPATNGTDRPLPAPLEQVVAHVRAAVEATSSGEHHRALTTLTQAADDFDRIQVSAPLGFTPHGVGALAGLLTGDLAAVEHLTNQAIAHGSGGPGEDLFHHLVRAYGRLVRGDYRSALELVRRFRQPGLVPAEGGWDDNEAGSDSGSWEGIGAGSPSSAAAGFGTGSSGPMPGGSSLGPAAGGRLAVAVAEAAGLPGLAVPQRDRLLLASLEAAIARRSGDTSRLRAAWQEAEQALLRPSVSWLLSDLFTELLCAGARIGSRRRVDPVVDELSAQALALPGAGPGPTAGWWLRLQVAIAADDGAVVDEAAAAMGRLTPDDERSQARIVAAAVWSRVMARRATEAEAIDAASRMGAVGDGWEASRLLGQAALDEADPRAARRLLELARVSSNDPVETSGDDALVGLGLSEREAEVALMVVEGRTHKEIGAQLFISPKTVEHHVAKIRQKLGATSRAELVATIRDAVGGS